MFYRALKVMAGLYASAIGTAIFQHRRMAARPLELTGMAVIRDLPDEKLEAWWRQAGGDQAQR